MLPIIGIACSTEVIAEGTYDIVARSYTEIIEANRGIPLVLPLIEEEEIRQEIFTMIDGLLLTGRVNIGTDVYNEQDILFPHSINNKKNNFQLNITMLALKNEIPILAVSQGMQLLTLAAGGQIYQNVSQQSVKHKETIKFYQNGSCLPNTHSIYIQSRTHLRNILNQENLLVVSNHHQAVKEIPHEFILSAYAEDGVIESIERRRGEYFCIGVQFNPEEMLEDDNQKKLFKAFVSSAMKYHLNKKTA